MIYHAFQDLQLSRLGFGAMRLPQLPDGSVDEAQVIEMTRYAMAHGVNYFDTAYPYHDGQSELALGKALAEFPRDSFYLATKYPGHQIQPSSSRSAYDPATIFEAQLKKCGVEYFDFYLLHNIYETSYETYTDPNWGILEYFKEQKRLGRIRHLGFSCHGSVDVIRNFLDYADGAMEFCQIQLNYLDWTLQDAAAKYALLTERNIPIWVMEPVRGGKLASLPEEPAAQLRALRPEETIPGWCFRFLQSLPNVTVTLSGMSNMDQMVANVATYKEEKPLTEAETATLMAVAETMKDAIPCTACRYCCSGCPQGLDIPMLLGLYNDLRFVPGMIASMRAEALPEDKRASACIGCGKCAQICPQGLDIPTLMQEFAATLAKLPSWAEICRQRDAAQPQ